MRYIPSCLKQKEIVPTPLEMIVEGIVFVLVMSFILGLCLFGSAY